jgi:hypothetical protein
MTLASATKDFAFDSGATKLPTIRDRDPLLTLQFGVLLFAFYLNCEMKGRQFAVGDTNVGFGPSGGASGARRGLRRWRDR